MFTFHVVELKSVDGDVKLEVFSRFATFRNVKANI